MKLWIKLIACAWLMLVSGVLYAGSTIYFVHSDHLGTPQVLTDKDQNVVWRSEEQTPFGEVVESGSVAQFMRFPGQYADAETGYYYNYYRDYDPSLGRYIQSDPIGLWGGLNTYAYVGGNPLRYSDPYGLDATDDRILTAPVVNAMIDAYNNAQVGTPNSHEEGGLFNNGEVAPAPPGDQTGMSLPPRMPNTADPQGKYHVHPDHEGTEVRSKPGYAVGDPNIPSPADKTHSSQPGRDYLITPDGRLIRYGENGVEEDLGPLTKRLNSCL